MATNRLILGRAYTSRKFLWHILPGNRETAYTSLCGISSMDWHDRLEKEPADIAWDDICLRCKNKHNALMMAQ